MRFDFSAISADRPLGKLLRSPLRLVPGRAIVRILQGRLRGKRWIVGSTAHGAWLGSYDPQLQTWLEERVKPGDVVYDIGANVGFFTLLASVLTGPEGHVYAFEPLPRNIRYLRRHLALNGVTNVTVVDQAVSDRAGVERLDADTWGHIGARFSPTGDVEVPTATLDQLVANGARAPDCMKINIEKAELRALTGAAETIATARPVVLLSTHGPEAARGVSGAARPARLRDRAPRSSLRRARDQESRSGAYRVLERGWPC